MKEVLIWANLGWVPQKNHFPLSTPSRAKPFSRILPFASCAAAIFYRTSLSPNLRHDAPQAASRPTPRFSPQLPVGRRRHRRPTVSVAAIFYRQSPSPSRARPSSCSLCRDPPPAASHTTPPSSPPDPGSPAPSPTGHRRPLRLPAAPPSLRPHLLLDATSGFTPSAPPPLDYLASDMYSNLVWTRLRDWVGVFFPVPASSQLALADWWLQARACFQKSYRRAFDSLIMMVSGAIWKERNARIFERIYRAIGTLVADIKEEVEAWRKAGIFNTACD
uniref:Uncharacterized protein n=1 Tax=Leersia perrieri TaxID=77586 RepID=A0A0D9VFJ4_9ORYZ